MWRLAWTNSRNVQKTIAYKLILFYIFKWLDVLIYQLTSIKMHRTNFQYTEAIRAQLLCVLKE